MITTLGLTGGVAAAAVGTARPMTTRQLAAIARDSLRTTAISRTRGWFARGEPCLGSLAAGGPPAQSRDGPERHGSIGGSLMRRLEEWGGGLDSGTVSGVAGLPARTRWRPRGGVSRAAGSAAKARDQLGEGRVG